MATTEAVRTEEEKKQAVQKAGELLFCGGTKWDALGRRVPATPGNLVSPTRLRPLVGIDICFVAAGSASCHCVALDVAGRCYTWGRNEKGQLGHGDTIQRDRPTAVSGLSKYKIVKAGSGRNHTVVVTEDGNSFAFGLNKHGQLGSGSTKNECELSPVPCLVSQVTSAVCGSDFTVWLSSLQGSSILTAGLPQYGQLGHGTDHEYNLKESSVRLAYEAQPRPRAIAAFSGKTVVKVACGANHTVAVDSSGLVYTWGYGGYGRLGHREQKDEWAPRLVEAFQKHNVLPPNAVVSAGHANSACTAGGGQLYMWGKIKSTGDDWMYPKPVMDLSGWNIRCMDSGYMHHFCGADDSCISWGHAQNGELGYGPMGPKSSSNAKKVDILDNMHVIAVACGYGHSMVIVDRANVADRLNQLEVYDGEVNIEGTEEPEIKSPATKKTTKKEPKTASENSKKRKKPKSESESESESEEGNDSDDNDDSEGDANGFTEVKKSSRGRKPSGRGRGKASKSNAKEEKSSGRGKGRGRGKAAKKGGRASK